MGMTSDHNKLGVAVLGECAVISSADMRDRRVDGVFQ